LYEYSRDLRKNSTLSEDILWQKLLGKQLRGLKFRRQHPLGKFIADFYCHEKRLVIELDGSVDDNLDAIEYDKAGTFGLNELKITVVRFRNEEVLNNIESVLQMIITIADDLHL
jgi:very-short-patch-repair endonuclease